MERRTFVLKVLTPLHVGSGESASGLEFIVENGKLRLYDFDVVLKALFETGKERKFLEKFKKPEVLNTTSSMQNLLKEVLDFLKKEGKEIAPAYSLPICPQALDYLSEEGGVNLSLFIKSSGRVFIPGSEVKGSMRRSLTSGVIRKLSKEVEELVKQKEKKGELTPKDILDIAEKTLQNAEKKLSVFRKGLSLDFFRFLRVKDSDSCLPDAVLKIVKVGYYHKKKKEWKSVEICEVIKEGTEFRLELSFDTSLLLKAKKSLKNLRFGFEKFLNLKNKDPLTAILEACDEENRRLCELYENNKKCKEFLNRIKEEDGYLLRLGKHEGKLSVTVLEALKEKLSDIDNRYVKLLEKNEGLENPITKKYAVCEDKKDFIPLGFCLLKPCGGQS